MSKPASLLSETIIQLEASDYHYTYNYERGVYFTYHVETKSFGAWYDCRMQHGWALLNQNGAGSKPGCLTGFLFKFNDKHLDINLFDKFWTYLENKLGLKQKTILYKTNLENIVLMKLSPFWTEDDTKNGLLTLFIRAAGVFYKGKGTFNQSLKDYILTKNIYPMIMRFLRGYTKDTEEFTIKRNGHSYLEGVVAEFENLTKEQLNTRLVKP